MHLLFLLAPMGLACLLVRRTCTVLVWRRGPRGRHGKATLPGTPRHDGARTLTFLLHTFVPTRGAGVDDVTTVQANVVIPVISFSPQNDPPPKLTNLVILSHPDDCSRIARAHVKKMPDQGTYMCARVHQMVPQTVAVESMGGGGREEELGECFSGWVPCCFSHAHASSTLHYRDCVPAHPAPTAPHSAHSAHVARRPLPWRRSALHHRQCIVAGTACPLHRGVPPERVAGVDLPD